MQSEFWLERWQRNEIGFHQTQINPYLARFWPAKSPDQAQQVFVPLCGKSEDMLWLRAQGYAVLGVELSPLALNDFLQTHALSPSISQHGPFCRYEMAQLSLWQGDFFALTAADLRLVTHVYDRAALVALPPAMRQAYAQHLRAILPPAAELLIVTFTYAQDSMAGPPFAVFADEVQQLFAADYEISLLASEDVLAQYPGFQQRGLSSLQEQVYWLSPRCVHS